LLRDSIPGMDKIIENDPLPGSVILVTGSLGSLKSSFVLAVMNSYLEKSKDKFGIYATMETHRQNHLENMQSIGIKPSPRLVMWDLASFRSGIPSEEMDEYIHPRDYISLVLRTLEKPRPVSDKENSKTPSCFAIDSLDSLWYLAKIDSNETRQKSIDVFYRLRQSGIFSFVILGSGEGTVGPEHFLADGIIELGTLRGKSGAKRFIRVRKMRSVRHSLDPFVIEVSEKGGLAVIGQMR
jgi:KaiC/GvpD/RAD55 family RecA-like ATPase